MKLNNKFDSPPKGFLTPSFCQWVGNKTQIFQNCLISPGNPAAAL